MTDWKKVAVHESVTIREAIQVIDKSSLQIALVIDGNDRLIGTITDGDIRRGLIRGVDLDSPVQSIYNPSPITASEYDDIDTIHRLMKQNYFKHLPILDKDGKVVRLELLKNLLSEPKRKNAVVLMAGGLGERLRPMTYTCPKPLFRIGGKPILEIILETFIKYDFKRFYISVNYMAEMIESYFGDGGRWNVRIDYLRENRKLGTAGSLSLLPEKPDDTLIVMNGDLLTKVNFDNLLDFHHTNKARATMCVREYIFKVPYGVVSMEEHRLLGLDEKPAQRFFVNAGIYLMEPDLLSFIPKDTVYNMTDLFQKICEKKLDVVTFPIREYWIDIGQQKDLEQAHGDFSDIFMK